MKTLSLVLLVATYIAMANCGTPKTCDIEPCVDMFSIVGPDRAFCNGTHYAHVCVGKLLDRHRCHGPHKIYVKDLQYRLQKIWLCICSSGDSVVSSLVLSVGAVSLAYFTTYLK